MPPLEGEQELDQETQQAAEAEADAVDTSESDEDQDESESQEGQEKPKEDKPDADDGTYLDFNRPETLTPERVKARIDAETRRKYEQEREIRELRQAREDLQRKLHETKKPQEIEPPPVDLAYENAEEFKRRNDAYLEAERKRLEWERDNEALQQQTQQAEQREKQQKVEFLVERAKKAGVDESALNMSAQNIGFQLQQQARSPTDVARHQEIMRYVIEHDYGPQLMVDLAKNPSEMQEIASLSATQAAVKLNEKARSYQQSLKSKAPPPDDPLRGVGAPPNERGPKGATYE